MDFNLTEEHLMIREAARDFAKQELLPGVVERDNKQEFPKEQVRKMGQLGFMGMMVDPKYGGGGMDTLSYAIVVEELSKIDASSSVIVSVNNSLVCYGIEKYANEEQKQKYVPKLASGEWIGCYCLTEPTAGSDANSGKTKAVLSADGSHYLISGQKIWISNAGYADLMIVFARIEDDKNITGFIIPNDPDNGISMGEEENNQQHPVEKQEVRK